MGPVSKKTLQIFKKWGERGGKKRAQRLSASKRQAIARHAAQIRWSREKMTKMTIPSVRLEKPSWENPVYLEEILSHGNLGAWRELRHSIADHPFGAESVALEKVLRTNEIYGTTFLWSEILRYLRGGSL